MPAPKISIQPVCLQTEHPSPAHTLQEISISTDGSVKGKKLGRKRISRSAPNICFANKSNVPFKSNIWSGSRNSFTSELLNEFRDPLQIFVLQINLMFLLNRSCGHFYPHKALQFV